MYLLGFVEETGSSAAVQEVMELLHVTVRELFGQVVTVNAGARSDTQAEERMRTVQENAAPPTSHQQCCRRLDGRSDENLIFIQRK